MNYYLSVDGGGTKLLAVIFDKELNLISCGRGGAINPNFDSMDSISATMEDCIKECLRGLEHISIEMVYISMPGPYELFLGILGKYADIKCSLVLSEGKMSLLAGIQGLRGAVALSGTGSGAFWIEGDKQIGIGGWGSLLGDEGSGYCIGRDGAIAAIKSYDGRGSRTILQEMILEEWKLNGMWDMAAKVYRSGMSPRSVLASLSPVVSRAANMGDLAALNILASAGEEMAGQIAVLMNKAGIAGGFKVVVSGGAWKGCRAMYNSFKAFLHDKLSDACVCVPLFDPVMGGIIREALENEGSLERDLLDKIKKNFHMFLYKTCWEEVDNDDKKIS